MVEPQAPPPAPPPPVVICLPGLLPTATRSGGHPAELMTLKASWGPGTYAIETTPSPGPKLVDCRRIQQVGVGPVLDFCTLDYQGQLGILEPAQSGIGPTLRRALLAVWYFVLALGLLIPARRRAKSPMAKWQLIIGFGAVVVLLLSVVVTVLAVLAALGVWAEPPVPSDAVDAVALGLTAFTTWLLAKARPAVQAAADLIRQFLHYAREQRFAASAASAVTAAVDGILEKAPERSIHLLTYSFGGLVALDFLFPPTSLHPVLDARHTAAIKTLTTIGCPVDFVRLYKPNWTADRVARIERIDWLNIFIAADVLGSNFVESDDVIDSAGCAAAGRDPAASTTLRIAEQMPTCVRYTDEVLTWTNVWGRKGFLSHGGYWGGLDEENCLHLVSARVLPAA